MAKTASTDSLTALLVFFAIVIIVVMVVVSNGQTVTINKKKQDSLIALSKYNISAQYIFFGAGTLSARVVVDDIHKLLVIFIADERSDECIELKYSEIVGCQINSNVAGNNGVERAIIGGMIAGGTGAIVGAVTSSAKVGYMNLSILRRSVTAPQVLIPLITSSVPQNSYIYQNAVAFASNVQATVNAILSLRPQDTFPSPNLGQQSFPQQQIPSGNERGLAFEPPRTEKEPEQFPFLMPGSVSKGGYYCPECGKHRTTTGICPYCGYGLRR